MDRRGRRARPARGRAGVVVAGMLGVAALVPSGGSARAQAPPKATGEPRISGTAIQGSTLTASNGSFSGTTPFNYAYRWFRCDATGGGGNGEGCTAITGATFRRYVLRAADVGHRLRVRVTASNAEGSATATFAGAPPGRAVKGSSISDALSSL